METSKIYEILSNEFPDARCELNYEDIYQLTIAVILSAQTTDKAVNRVTPTLFSTYHNFEELSQAKYDDLYNIIKPLGLASSKTKNLIALANIVKTTDIVPDFDILTSLPGIGRKTANVILSEGFHQNRIAVDTHVSRVSYNLGLTKSKDVVQIENDLMNQFDESLYHQLHLKLLFFGRYICTAKSPLCNECPFTDICIKQQKTTPQE